MDINKSCKTCEFNFDGICAGHGSFYEYGAKITDTDTQRECWNISLEYVEELGESLPPADQYIFENNDSITPNHLIERIETGQWNIPQKRRRNK